jgi:hypothetical protein
MAEDISDMLGAFTNVVVAACGVVMISVVGTIAGLPVVVDKSWELRLS